MSSQPNIDRREIISAAATGLALAGLGGRRASASQPDETNSSIVPQPMPSFADDQTTADIMVDI